MVQIDLNPLVDILTTDKEEVRDRARTRIRGTGTTTKTSVSRFNWSNVQPRLVITSDTDDFDQVSIAHFEAEGFQITYVPYLGDKNDYHNKLQHLADPLDMGEKYAIVGM